eukprot:TRINITY_DN264_c0_g1_i7.p3 TRINITY_DN264_c0_g1~~TRINITY_DN264_c0_g1_i7.p3  ORF type:complete len:100 (-),score=24.90 TRINITY_DN264_c0_g1_i7:216-515(-)
MLVVDVIAVGNYICSSRACDEIRWCRQKETVVGWIGIHIGQMAQCLRNPATERRDIKKEEKKKRRKEEKKKRIFRRPASAAASIMGELLWMLLMEKSAH